MKPVKLRHVTKNTLTVAEINLLIDALNGLISIVDRQRDVNDSTLEVLTTYGERLDAHQHVLEDILEAAGATE